MNFISVFFFLKVTFSITSIALVLNYNVILCFIILTILGLIGQIEGTHNFSTDLSYAYEVFGLSTLFIFTYWIIKCLVYNPKKIKGKSGMITASLVQFKPKQLLFWIWHILIIGYSIVDLVFFHWFTTFDLSKFWWSMLALTMGGFTIMTAIGIIVYNIDKRIKSLNKIFQDHLGVLELAWFLMQYPLFNFCMWGGYEGLYKKLDLPQSIAALISLAVYWGETFILGLIIRLLKRQLSSKEREEEEEDSYKELSDEVDVELLVMNEE